MKISWASTDSVIAPAEQHPVSVKPPTRSSAATGKPTLTSRAKGKGKGKAREEAPKRTRPLQRGSKLQSIGRSAKKHSKKRKVESHNSKNVNADYSFIFVGNLESTITQDLLDSAFRKYGTITRIQIRCSGGQAVTIGVAIPKAIKGPRDRLYASIEFTNPTSARRALEMDGKVLDGCLLVVTHSAADLPEVKDIVEDRLKSMRARSMKSKPLARKLLQVEPTERFIGYGTPGADRHRILGFSFAASVV